MTSSTPSVSHFPEGEPAGIVTRASPFSVSETVERCLALIAAKGMKLFAVVDHSAEAESAGLELRQTKVVIFGSPARGTPIMAFAPLAALDLPLKVLIWADGDTTKVSYTAPAELAARYGFPSALRAEIEGIDAIVTAIASRIPTRPRSP